MKSIKSVINVVREWAQEICEEDDRQLFQRIDDVIADEGRIYLHICDGNHFVLESIDVRGGDGVQIFLADNDHDKTCLYTLRECEDFEPMEYCMRGCPGSEFFTPDRLTELRRRIKDLPEIKEAKEKCKADNIKLVSDPNKRTPLRPDNVDIIDIITIENSDNVRRIRSMVKDIIHDEELEPWFDKALERLDDGNAGDAKLKKVHSYVTESLGEFTKWFVKEYPGCKCTITIDDGCTNIDITGKTEENTNEVK